VGVDGRVAELAGDEFHEFFGQGVLEDFGLVVDLVPRHVEDLG
jgi:hypothetical protein